MRSCTDWLVSLGEAGLSAFDEKLAATVQPKKLPPGWRDKRVARWQKHANQAAAWLVCMAGVEDGTLLWGDGDVLSRVWAKQAYLTRRLDRLRTRGVRPTIDAPDAIAERWVVVADRKAST